MNIGIIGAGALGSNLARALAKTGSAVIVSNSRSSAANLSTGLAFAPARE